MSGLSSKFETEEEVQDKRQKRQAEWEKVRKPEDPIEAPEEETRSLFEQLQANKTLAEQEAEEEQKLRASVKGLEEEEVHFLNHVSNRQQQIEKDRSREEQSVIAELRNKSNTVITIEEKQKASGANTSSSSSSSAAAKKSQLQLLKGAIKRKSTDSKPDIEEKKSLLENDGSSRLTADLPPSSTMQCAGILPGLGDYVDNDSSTENSSASSDSEADHQVIPSDAQVKLMLAEYRKKLKEGGGCS